MDEATTVSTLKFSEKIIANICWCGYDECKRR